MAHYRGYCSIWNNGITVEASSREEAEQKIRATMLELLNRHDKYTTLDVESLSLVTPIEQK